MSTELVAVIATPTVAIVAIVAGVVQHWQSLKKQRELADLASVRDVLDEGSTRLLALSYTVAYIGVDLEQHGARTYFVDPDRARRLIDLNDEGKACDEILSRLSVRLGRPHETYTTYEAAIDAAVEVLRAMKQIRRAVNHPAKDPNAIRQLDEIIETETAKVDEFGALFEAKRDAFADASHCAAGAKLFG